jgi:cephalosporin hydroxylase
MYNIDVENRVITDTNTNQTVPFGSKEGFKIISDLYLGSGWESKYVYTFSWLGRPVIQLPDDMIRIQEVIYNLKPDVIIETGIAHGGSLVYYASLCKLIGKGRVIGIDIEIRPHNRKATEEHFLYNEYITMIEGSSVDESVVKQVENLVKPGETVLVLLDSNHFKGHVLKELEAYSKLVSVGSYIIATDGIMKMVTGLDRTTADFSWNNPKDAAIEFVTNNKNFVIEQPTFPFSESVVDEMVTYWQGGYIKRIK